MDSWLWILVTCALSWFIYYYYRQKHHNFKDWGIPQPREIPIFGVTAFNIIRGLHVADVMSELYNMNKNAKYVGVHMFMTPVVVVRDIELVKAVLVKDFDHFTGHKEILDETVDPLFAKNLIAINGDKWRELRNMLSPAFTSSKMKTMFELMSSCAENFTESFAKQFVNEEETDMKEAFSKYTNDVIATCAFGIEIDSMKDPTNEFYVYGKRVNNTEGIVQLVLIVKLLLISTFPKLAKALNIKLMSADIKDFFINVIDTAIKTRDEKGITRPDMLQLMMSARGKTSDNVKLDIVDMTAQAFLFFAAGFETASSHMSLMAHEIACNPDVQENLHAEVDAVWEATNGKITYEAITNMPYLDAVFQETLRMHPQLSFLSRNCTKDYELPPTLPHSKPYVIQAGEEVMIPVAAIHRDPAFYKQPDKFDPERFVGKKITTSDVTSLGFGLGPRMCIGNRFAILETKVLFFHLLKKCILQPWAKTCIPMKYSSRYFVPKPKQGFWLKIKERRN